MVFGISLRKRASLRELLEKYNFNPNITSEEKGHTLYEIICELVNEHGTQLSNDLERDLRQYTEMGNPWPLLKPIMHAMLKSGIKSMRLDKAFHKFLYKKRVYVKNASRRSKILFVNDEDAKRFLEERFEKDEIFIYRSKMHPEAEDEKMYDGWAF